MEEERFRIRHLPSLLWTTSKEWMADNPFRLSAITAYYAVLSLPALLVIILKVVGNIWGPDVVQGQMTDEFSTALGQDVAMAIEGMITEAQNKKKNTISTIIGIGTLVFGATGVFYHLKVSLNQIWSIRPDPKAHLRKLLIDRARSFAFVLVIGFLLLISFILTTLITALSGFITSYLPDMMIYLAYTVDFVMSIGIISILFALMFKYLPDAQIRWKTVWIGALLTAFLFVLGKLLLSLYFAQMEPGSAYGAAGSIVLILLWVSYSCLILFFGAEFVKVFAKRYGHGIQPKDIAFKVE